VTGRRVEHALSPTGIQDVADAPASCAAPVEPLSVNSVACIASAAALPAPRKALAEIKARSHPAARSSTKPATRRAA
jgi:hypothetical protein